MMVGVGSGEGCLTRAAASSVRNIVVKMAHVELCGPPLYLFPPLPPPSPLSLLPVATLVSSLPQHPPPSSSARPRWRGRPWPPPPPPPDGRSEALSTPLPFSSTWPRRLRRHCLLRPAPPPPPADPVAKAKCHAGVGRGALEVLELDAFAAGGLEMDGYDKAATRAARASSSSSGRLDAEKMWMEMYQVGHWGFGRLSISMTPPPPARPDCAAAARSDGGRKDADLPCESSPARNHPRCPTLRCSGSRSSDSER
ncbi:hypothetical protein SETIT_3G287900v2 [Setaria italica]|uniref:Uncharacterized protein n=1 Tax=Setaria italica TaxID=4555 RepID=A0A368QK35_SETIT|nr:hypothetical protein SETIT_3G287900v2 [Setaria italica]